MLMRLRLKGAFRLMSVENLSTGIEASASGESLNSVDPAVHPAARHSSDILRLFTCWKIPVPLLIEGPTAKYLPVHYYISLTTCVHV